MVQTLAQLSTDTSRENNGVQGTTSPTPRCCSRLIWISLRTPWSLAHYPDIAHLSRTLSLSLSSFCFQRSGASKGKNKRNKRDPRVSTGAFRGREGALMGCTGFGVEVVMLILSGLSNFVPRLHLFSFWKYLCLFRW